MERARNMIVEMIQQHENCDHDGQTCWIERANAIAFLAHSLGLSQNKKAWGMVFRILKTTYEKGECCNPTNGR